MAKRRSYWERYALNQLSLEHQSISDEELYILDASELKALKRIRNRTYLRAGLAGALGVILLYTPYHLFGEALFPKRMFTIPFLEKNIELEVEFLIYSVILVLIEITYMSFLNIKAVTDIANACGCPNQNDPNKEENMNSLINVGLDKKQKQLEQLGINPYEGLSKWGVYAFQTLIRLKAAISGFLWKLFVSKILGRYAFRMLVDLLGAPLYAGWNIYSSRKIMNEARVRVMAPPLIYKYAKLLHDEFKDNDQFKKHLYDGLHAISTTKRSFHYNHFLLASSLLNKFEIELEGDPPVDNDFLQKIDEFEDDLQKAFSKLILFGIMIDGGITWVEKRSIRRLRTEGVLKVSDEQIYKWSNDFFEGKGMDSFFAY